MNQKDVVLEEYEFATISQSIVTYVNLLKESITSYYNILAMVEKDGFQDIELTNKLTQTADKMKNEVSGISKIGPDVHKQLNNYMEKIEEIDQFTFPSEFQEILDKILCL